MDKSASNRTYRQRNHTPAQLDKQIDWTAIAPEVAVRLKGEPRTKTDKEWRWGSKGSFALYLEQGKFSDYENGVAGGVIDMVQHCEGITNRQEAVQWLRDNDFLPRSGTSPRPRPSKPKPKAASAIANPPPNSGEVDYGLSLWNDARPVPTDNEHPVRRWSNGLLALTTPMPDAIRFHSERCYILCCVTTLENWLNAYPRTPKPQAVHVIAIDPQGTKRYPAKWDGANKRTYGRVHGCGFFLAGNPDSNRFNICEGVKDSLAIFEREAGAVIASLTTFSKLTNHPSLIKHIAERNPVLFPDMDEAGKIATVKLSQALRRAGASVRIRQGADGDDPADSALKENL